MTSPLLATKLYVPKLRRRPVARTRLSDRLREGAQSKLTVVSAPAGFGKTTLLAEWVAGPAAGRSTAWLSLDRADSEPTSFWTYLIGALQTVVPGIGASALSTLQGPHPPPIETVLASLLNDLAAAPDRVVLVLDDYHLIEAHDVQVGMAYLLEHLPPQVHVVIATRADPALPLSRLRARGELVEIRAADLRFTPDEATSYLNGVMGLDLSAPDVDALEGRTEGWIAALQLAGLSLQGRDDAAGFIAGFAGDDRYIVDYLVEEVLQRQPERVRGFLLETSILTRMSGALCDAVTGQEGGKAMLETLERGNLFLVPLDDRRQWYRYHHLFADVLQARLLDERPDDVAELHRRASAWFERNGERMDAIGHAIAGDDLTRAAALIELTIPETSRARREATLAHWLAQIPDDMIRVRPVLSDAYAGSILVRGETEGVEMRLQDAERWLDPDGSTPGPGARSAEMVVTDEAAFRALPGGIAIHRAGLARILGDVAGTMTHARRALELIGDDEHVGRAAAAALLGLSHWSLGELDQAHRLYVAAMADLETAGYLADAIGCALTLADIEIAQGRLDDAMRTFERGLRISTSQGGPAPRATADMYVGLSGLFRERNDLDSASRHLRLSQELGEENGLPQNPYRSRVAAARILQAGGDFDGALELLGEAERLFAPDFSPDVRPVAALKARVATAAGRLTEAAGWARERDLSMADDLIYLHEYEHVTLGKVLLAQATRDRATPDLRDVLQFLARLLAAAEAGGRLGSVIDILIVQALAFDAAGDQPAAVASLVRALELAAPQGYQRIFIDEGPPMVALLKAAAKRSNAPTAVRPILAAAVAAGSPTPTDQGLIEPLSERELDVLRLLASDLDGPDIAHEMSVSLATVRTHTANIYAKLGVNNRRAAVSRATELGLVSRDRERRPTQ